MNRYALRWLVLTAFGAVALAAYDVGTGDVRAALSVVLIWVILVAAAVLARPQKPSESHTERSERVLRDVQDWRDQMLELRLRLVPPPPPEPTAPFDWQEEREGASL